MTQLDRSGIKPGAGDRLRLLLLAFLLLASGGVAAFEFQMRSLDPTWVPGAEGSGYVNIVGGQFDADRRLDMAMCFNWEKVKIFSQDAQGEQVLRHVEPIWDQSDEPFPRPILNCRVHALDLDGNGIEDLVVSHRLGVLVLKLFADGRVERQEYGRRGQEFENGDGFLDSVMADFNGDGRVDLVGIRPTGGLYMLVNQGDGNFSPAVDAGRMPLTEGFQHAQELRLAVGDLDGNGFPDVVVALSRVDVGVPAVTAVLYNDGRGHLVERTERIVHPMIYYRQIPAIGDVTGDGKDDLVIILPANLPYAALTIHEQDGQGRLKPVVYYSAYHIPDSLWIGDVDGDGRNDVVLLHSTWHSLTTYLQQGDGSLEYLDLLFPVYALEKGVNSMVVRDFRGSGCRSVLMASRHYSWADATGCLPSSNADVAASLVVNGANATLHIDNLDPALPAFSVVATIRLDSSDASTRFPAAPAGCTVSPANVMARVYVCRIARMEAGETRTIHLPLAQKGTRPQGYRVSARARVSSHGEDPNPANNVASRDSWTVTRRPASRLPVQADTQPRCRVGRCIAPR